MEQAGQAAQVCCSWLIRESGVHCNERPLARSCIIDGGGDSETGSVIKESGACILLRADVNTLHCVCTCVCLGAFVRIHFVHCSQWHT